VAILTPAPSRGATLDRSDRLVVGTAALGVAAAGLTRYADLGPVTAFACSAVAVALLATVVARSVDQIGERLGAGATGVLQSALGNLPELFIALFALHSGLVTVVQAAIVGSILGNVLFILGLAFLVGGLKHGTLRFDSERARTICTLMLLAVAALLVPSLAAFVHTPASRHEHALSIIAAVVLLLVFALSVPASLRRSTGAPSPAERTEEPPHPPRWPLWLAVALLALSGLLAALVSDWFVHALEPAIAALHISQAFAGLIIVAIAGNAIENVVGIQLAARGSADYALSVILNSPLQIALVLAPVLVLVSPFVGTTLTLVLPPLLVTTLIVSVVVSALIIYDGEAIWLEGVALLGLYVVIAAAFWWG
jgi:Ca2+:H+ antiporter